MQPRPIREARSAKTPCGACGWDGRYPGVLGWLPGLFGDVAEGRGAVPEGSEGNGYSTAAVGKWHLTPEKEQGPAGPFDHWPNAWGFDYYWGFLAPEAGQFDTMIAENQKFIGVQEGRDGKPFYFPEAMTDQAIDWLHGVRGHDSEKPWCLYYSTGCSHAPHHVWKEWAEKYKGRFDQGWDKPRGPGGGPRRGGGSDRPARVRDRCPGRRRYSDQPQRPPGQRNVPHSPPVCS